MLKETLLSLFLKFHNLEYQAMIFLAKANPFLETNPLDIMLKRIINELDSYDYIKSCSKDFLTENFLKKTFYQDNEDIKNICFSISFEMYNLLSMVLERILHEVIFTEKEKLDELDEVIKSDLSLKGKILSFEQIIEPESMPRISSIIKIIKNDWISKEGEIEKNCDDAIFMLNKILKTFKKIVTSSSVDIFYDLANNINNNNEASSTSIYLIEKLFIFDDNFDKDPLKELIKCVFTSADTINSVAEITRDIVKKEGISDIDDVTNSIKNATIELIKKNENSSEMKRNLSKFQNFISNKEVSNISNKEISNSNGNKKHLIFGGVIIASVILGVAFYYFSNKTSSEEPII